MPLAIPRAFFRPALLLAVATGLTTAAIPITATAASPAPSAVIHPVTDLGLASQDLPSTSSSARVVSTMPRGARTLLPRTHVAAAAGPAQARLVLGAGAAQSLAEGASGQLLTSFNGVSSLDSAVTNFGAEFEPPDQGLCEGNGFVLEPVNSAYTIYHTNGTPIAGPFNVNNLFARGGLEFTSDPRCYYDPTTNTWFATILFIATLPNGNFGSKSALDISVNTSGDPTTAWTTYHIDTTDAHSKGCPCFGDQPRLGIDAFNLYVSTDEFSILGPQFNGGQLYAFAKGDLVSLKPHIHFAHFADLNIAGVQTLAIEPAITNGPSDAEYFLESIDPTGTVDNRIGVWAMTNRDEVGRGVAPTLSSLVIGSEAFGVPPKAIQKGGSSLLDTGDDRMQQTQFINGTIWGELDTAVTNQDGTPVSSAAWFNVRPSLSGGTLGSATMTRQGYLTLRNDDFLLYPALQADQAGNAAMVFTVSGADRFASAAFATMRSDQSNFGQVTIAANGTGPYDPNATRWGDYSWTQVDLKTDTFWMATEYIPPVASQTTDGLRNWGTEVLQVRVSGSARGD